VALDGTILSTNVGTGYLRPYSVSSAAHPLGRTTGASTRLS
jgi:hypothetical protein